VTPVALGLYSLPEGGDKTETWFVALLTNGRMSDKTMKPYFNSNAVRYTSPAGVAYALVLTEPYLDSAQIRLTP
jgi:hypothetical protein